MKHKKMKFNSDSFLLFDSKDAPKYKDNHLLHFALTDALIEYAGENNQAIIHFWKSSPLVILGMMDTKIKQFKKARQIFKKYNYDHMIRNSGGLAVVSDPGILNISLIYPLTEKRKLSINQAYELMLDFIRQTFYPYFPKKKIDAFEIKHSYCFGDYDLSIEGQKIAGISQRRVKNGIAIMIYISVNGNQKKRTKMLKEFYSIGLDGSEPKNRYPDIKIESMTSLEDAYETKLTIPTVKKMMLSHFDWSTGKYTEKIQKSLEQSLEKMYQRNIKFLDEDYVKNNLS